MGIREVQLRAGDDDLPFVEIVTLKAGFTGRGYVTCDEPYEVMTHWVGRRTLPCLGENCGACQAHVPAKYEGYVSLVWSHSRTHQIVRMTKPAVLQLKNQTAQLPSLRGSILSFERKGKRANGRVLVRVEALVVESIKLPLQLDLRRHMIHVWRVDGIEVHQDERLYIHNLNEFTSRKLLEAKEFNAKKDQTKPDDGGAASAGGK